MLKNRINIAFLSVIGIYVFFGLFANDGWFLSGQMYAEMATNYFPTALDPQWGHKLFAIDAGYIPLPQRLIAAFVAFFSPPAKAIPFIYNGFTLLFTGMLVAPFCLSRFRQFVKSDAARFFTCLLLLLVIDFETRVFINFTYFAIPFLFYVALTAFDRYETHLPRWTWFAPIFLLSKPAVMSAFPLLMLALVFNFRKCWKLVAVCFVVVVIQMVRLKLSAAEGLGVGFQGHFTFLEKLYATLCYSLGSLGAYTLGPLSSRFIHNPTSYILWGSFFFILSATAFFFIDREKKFLLVSALLLIFLNVFLNCFSLSLEWNHDLARLSTVPVQANYRHVIGIFFGVVFFVLAFFEILGIFLSRLSSNKISARYFCMLFLLAWAVGSGWVKVGIGFSHRVPFAMVGASNWHELSSEIDISTAPVCVFLDPYPWIYSKNCHVMGEMPAWPFTKTWVPLSLNHSLVFGKGSLPSVKENPLIISLAVIARPLSDHTLSSVNIRAEIVTHKGQTVSYVGQKKLDRSGGVIQLLPMDKKKLSFHDIAQLALSASAPIALFSNPEENTTGMPIIFLGS